MRLPAAQQPGTEAKRVLIYRIGSLGDTLVSLPAMSVVARAFPHAERRLLTNFPIAQKAPASAAVFENTGLIHSYERYEIGLRNPLRLLGLVWRLRRWKPDLLVYLSPARGVEVAKRDAMFFRVAGLRRMIGIPLTEDMQKVRPLRGGLLEREGDRLTRTIAELGPPEAGSWRLQFSEEERARAGKVLHDLGDMPFFAISLGTKVQTNEWGLENWKTLLGKLAAAFPSHALVITGAKDDFANSEYVAEGWRAASSVPTLNLCGTISPRESGAVFARARLYLGHDSGPLHLAAASGVQCIGIFSARNPAGMWWPYGEGHRILYHPVSCSPCGLNVCIAEGKRCILSISVDEVLETVRAAMAERGDR
ncbi:MAG: glycosyltransferase family 9 protein [Acidobacteria bacterium]|nr:glycosyltransferase family 9 protein [Acidobacteriota bacterium]